MSSSSREGPGKGWKPVSIVFRSPMTLSAYVAAGRDLVIPPLPCTTCSEVMGGWGWYRRDVRVDGDGVRVWVRRVRCSGCRRSHAVLPEFVTFGRLDPVEVIGLAVAAMAAGMSARRVAAAARVAHTTVREWRRRFRDRARLLLAAVVGATVAVSGLAPRHRDGVVGVVEAVEVLRVAAERRWRGRVPSGWRLANVVVGGHLLSTNMDPLSPAT
jgi:hypothetical protein